MAHVHVPEAGLYHETAKLYNLTVQQFKNIVQANAKGKVIISQLVEAGHVFEGAQDAARTPSHLGPQGSSGRTSSNDENSQPKPPSKRMPRPRPVHAPPVGQSVPGALPSTCSKVCNVRPRGSSFVRVQACLDALLTLRGALTTVLVGS